MNARAQQLVQTEIALTYLVDMSAIVTRASDLSTMIVLKKFKKKAFKKKKKKKRGLDI